MARPAVTATTDLVFGSLPEFIQRADTVDWDLLRYLAVVCDQIDVTQTVTNEISTTVFTNPALVRAVWLPWLTQATGVTIGAYWTDTTTRARLGDTVTYYAHGTVKAIRQTVIDRYPAATGAVVNRQWLNNIWLIVVNTTPAQTPLSGVLITTFGELQDTFPTFVDMSTSAVTFADLLTVDRIHVDVATTARVEEPAGAKLYHGYA